MQDFGKPADTALEARLAQLDTLRYRVHAHTTPPGQRARVAVTLKTLHSPAHQGGEALHTRLRRVLAHFLPLRWTLFLTGRQVDDAGVETLTYRASALLPVPMPADLPARARAASSETVSLSSPEISVTFDPEDYQRRMEALRDEARRTIAQEQAALEALSGRRWEVRELSVIRGPVEQLRRTVRQRAGSARVGRAEGFGVTVEVLLEAGSRVLH